MFAYFFDEFRICYATVRVTYLWNTVVLAHLACTAGLKRSWGAGRGGRCETTGTLKPVAAVLAPLEKSYGTIQNEHDSSSPLQYSNNDNNNNNNIICL